MTMAIYLPTMTTIVTATVKSSRLSRAAVLARAINVLVTFLLPKVELYSLLFHYFCLYLLSESSQTFLLHPLAGAACLHYSWKSEGDFWCFFFDFW